MTRAHVDLPHVVDGAGVALDPRSTAPDAPAPEAGPVPADLRGDWTAHERERAGWQVATSDAGKRTAWVVAALLAVAIATPLALLVARAASGT